tara:strand:- start:39 stop:248 length:210 start_codon:yes stop_codon:yes gene_type:complete
MLTKKTKTILVETYSFGGYGPYDSAELAFRDAVDKHIDYDGDLDDSFLQDKELLIALGEWAKQEIKDAY